MSSRQKDGDGCLEIMGKFGYQGRSLVSVWVGLSS